MATTTLDYGSVVYSDPIHEDDSLDFAGADTYLEGTLLGRITASGFLAPFDPGAVSGVENPIAVLTYEASNTGAGQIPCRALIGGVVRKERLVIHGDPDLSNLTQAHVDALRAAGVTAVSVQDLSVLES